MFNLKFFALFVFAAILPAFAQNKTELKISDYLKILPAEYKTFSGDFESEPTAETTLIDEKNGYAAYFNEPVKHENSFPVFEMAVFKSAGGRQILFVSNLISDPVCNEYKTFFLEKRGENWVDVKAEVLPELTPEMFFDTGKTAGEFLAAQKKIGNSTDLNPRFSPLRANPVIEAKLEICDYVPDEFAGEIDFRAFIEKTKAVSLDWNKRKGVFNVR